MEILKPDFLVKLAHVRSIEEAVGFGKAYAEVFAGIDGAEQRKVAILDFADVVRKAWREQDADERDWMIFVLRARFAIYAEQGRDALKKPPATPFDALVTWFGRNPGLFRFCQNPDCRHPYYIPNTRKPTKFCSLACSIPAKREARLKWYYSSKKGEK